MDEMRKLKDLKRGEYFTLRPIHGEWKAEQAYKKCEYDRSERKYWCMKCSDISDGKYLSGDRIVYQEGVF